MEIFCGIDWAEHHHDVVVVDSTGRVLIQRRVSDDLAGFMALTTLLDHLSSARREVGMFYPAALQAFTDLTTKTALAILAVAPIPGQALCLTHDDIRDLARGCGRWGISLREVTRIHDVLHQPQLRQAAQVEQAMGTAVLHLTLGLRITNLTISRLAAALL